MRVQILLSPINIFRNMENLYRKAVVFYYHKICKKQDPSIHLEDVILSDSHLEVKINGKIKASLAYINDWIRKDEYLKLVLD